MRYSRPRRYVILVLALGGLLIGLNMTRVDTIVRIVPGLVRMFNGTRSHVVDHQSRQQASRDDPNVIQYVNPFSGRTVNIRLTLTPSEQRTLCNNTGCVDSRHPLFRKDPLRHHGVLPHRIGRHDAQSVRLDQRTSGSKVARDLDILGMRNLTFLAGYKNPCWRDIHRSLRCLPYFYLIGAPKSGTTDLYKRLCQHPDFVKPTKKEPHWLTRNRIESDVSKGESSLGRYVTYFSRLAADLEDAKTDRSGLNDTNNLITGDCSASTLWDNTAWHDRPHNPHPLEPVYTNPDYVYKLNPSAKIIVLLRHPTSRLYSDYLYFHNRTDGETHQAVFHNLVVSDLKVFTKCLEKYSLRHCVYSEKVQTDMVLRLHIGIYYVYLREWYRRFPRQQILVLKAEDYSIHILRELTRVFRFLGLRTLHDEYMSAIVQSARANVRPIAKVKLGDMWSETRRLLDTFYSLFNVQLSRLLQQHGHS